jgi:hypothetical protein
MRGGVLPWLVCWTRRSGTIDFCLALAALVSPVQNIIFLTAHFFTATWAGRRAGSPVSVSLGKMDWGKVILAKRAKKVEQNLN